MNVGLGWLGVGVGAVGCVATYLMAGGNARSGHDADVATDRRTAWLAAGVTLALTVIMWAIAMRKELPFSPGQGLALGLLIGGVTGAVAILLSFRLSEIVSGDVAARSVRLGSLSNLFYALFAVSLAYALFASNPWEPLMGFAMGATMAAILHTFTQRGQPLAIRTETWALFGITIAAGVLLAMRHFDVTQLRMWWAVPILIATSILAACYVGIELASMGKLKDNAGKSYAVAVVIASTLVVGLCAIYSWKIVNSWQLLEVVLVGLGVGAVVAWLAASLTKDASEAGRMEAGAACLLLVAAFATVAFKLWSGLGIAIGLLGAWTVAIPALGERRDSALGSLWEAVSWPLYPGLVIVLFRLFVQQYAHDLRTTDMQIHYTFIGAMLGAILPFVFAAGLMRLRDGRAGSFAIAGVVLLGLVAAASPLLLLVLWEIKAVLGFAFGLTAAMAFMLLARVSGDDGKYSVGLLAVAGLLSAIQFVGPVMGLEMTRSTRITVLAIALALGVVWFGLSSVLAARRGDHHA